MSTGALQPEANPVNTVRGDVAGLPTDAEIRAILPKVKIIAEDGIPLESAWHRKCINLLIDVVEWRRRDRPDFYVGGNQFIYFDEEGARNRNLRGPDFFFVDEVAHDPPRECWVVWLEGGRYPDVIIELSSESTRDLDLTVRKDTYERVFRTPEYFVYDPKVRRLRGWRLSTGGYEELTPNEHGRLWCNQLGVWIGMWPGHFQGYDGVWLRFFDKDGTLLLTGVEEEAEARAAAQQRAETERQRAETERQRAEAEHQRAQAERQRADALAAEVAQLRAQMAKRGPESPADTGTPQ